MNHDGHRKLQQDLLDRVLPLLKADPRVLGLVLAGSYARDALYLFENGVRLDVDFCTPPDLVNPTEVYFDPPILCQLPGVCMCLC